MNPAQMPTLDWIGKPAVVNRHNDVPFHLLCSKARLGTRFDG